MSKQMQGYRGSLDLYYQVEDSNGNFGEVFPAGNVTDFQIIPDAEELEIISTGNADYGQAADTMIDAKPTKCSFSVNRFNIDTLANAFMGSYAARTASAGTVDAGDPEDVTAYSDGISRLNHIDISNLVIKDETDTTTYVLDTDYEIVDAKLGLIKVLSTGSISGGDTLHASYSYAAESGYLLSGGTSSSRFLKMWGRGVNRFNNKESRVEIPRGSIKPNGNFSMVGNEAATVGFDVTINVPTDGSAPFTIITDA
ncbi:phage tail tube protein [Desulforhopalus singaporensis]|uniref:Uncharacterized protein n=1 Tax=Desulforhopalus singaporensis TaxID=91360 RepID=A0A1H0UU35_9BACT|nr:hypothetical protein [Desulforhopalus singaporensis]SDP69722.1 hypothetical protein SAMN05660330_03719 [Desulforhopalus singaporensis]